MEAAELVLPASLKLQPRRGELGTAPASSLSAGHLTPECPALLSVPENV